MASEKSSGSWRVSLPLPRPTEGHALSHLRLLPFPRHTRRYLHTPGPTLQSASPTPKPPSVSPGLLHPGTPTLISLQGPLGQNVHQGATPLQDPQKGQIPGPEGREGLQGRAVGGMFLRKERRRF